MMGERALWQKAHALLQAGVQVVAVRVDHVKGSAPREQGAMMLVTDQGTYGSIGGGTLEWQASARAQKALHLGTASQSMSFALGPDLGQCCGGHVSLGITRLDTAAVARRLAQGDAKRRQVYLFGAGHVAKALVLALAQTDFDIIWLDARPGAFPAAVPHNVTCVDTEDAAPLFAKAHPGSIALVMTHSHALDLAIVDAALRCPNIAETGLIGSTTKRARFESRLRTAGVEAARIASLICPIGVGGIRSKLPVAIAISTAAQLLALDETLAAAEENMSHNTRSATR